MKDISITVPIKELTMEELAEADRVLVEHARIATYNAYAPYSKFNVGAAIALDNGEIITGANQENAAFPSGTCAERTACFYAGARYPEAKFLKIAIAARGTDGEFLPTPISPCGACRQSLLEYETLSGHDVPVLLIGRSRIFELPSVKSLLPLAFTDF